MAELEKKEQSMKRDPQEIVDIFRLNVSMLQHLCNEFDKGRTESALWIAAILRTLLHTNGKNPISIIDQLKEIDNKYDINFLSTSFPTPQTERFSIGWDFGDHVCGMTISYDSVFTGLIIKTLHKNCKGDYIANVRHKEGDRPQKNEIISFEEWWEEEIFHDYRSNYVLTRNKAIRIVADKDGGAHLDPTIPYEYVTFRHPQLAKIYRGGKEIPFSRNPVYVSIRQIAWEVLESFKGNGLIKDLK